jgi:hypothetical protein
MKIIAVVLAVLIAGDTIGYLVSVRTSKRSVARISGPRFRRVSSA